MAQGPELSEYPIQGKKTGLLWGFSFEAQVNDDLEQLMLVPDAMPQMAVDTEDDRGLRLLIDLETGALNTAFFKVANGNIGTLELTPTTCRRCSSRCAPSVTRRAGRSSLRARCSWWSATPCRRRPSGS
jgi:hypothetical protein